MLERNIGGFLTSYLSPFLSPFSPFSLPLSLSYSLPLFLSPSLPLSFSLFLPSSLSSPSLPQFPKHMLQESDLKDLDVHESDTHLEAMKRFSDFTKFHNSMLHSALSIYIRGKYVCILAEVGLFVPLCTGCTVVVWGGGASLSDPSLIPRPNFSHAPCSLVEK